MVRVQIQFTTEQKELLDRLSRTTGQSIAELVRESVDRHFGQDGGQAKRAEDLSRAFSMLGKFHGGKGHNVSVEHDKYLDEAYYDWHDRK